MRALGPLRHAIEFGGSFRPDLLVEARPQSVSPAAWRIDGEVERVDDGALHLHYHHQGLDGGALEAAIPWRLIGTNEGSIALVALVAGEEGSGSGDAAPNPNGALSSLRSRTAFLDRALNVAVDGELDGDPDEDVSRATSPL